MTSSTTTIRRAWAALVVALLLALGGLGVPRGIPSASAAVGDPSIVQCFYGPVTGASCTTITPSWFWASDSTFSPDGRQLYVLTLFGPAGIRVFDRGPDNALSPKAGASGCYHPTGEGSCAVVPNLGAQDIAFSPDGLSAYVAAGGNLLHLGRAPADGALTPVGCYGPGSGCSAVPSLNAASAVAVSADGRNVYVRGPDRLLVFDRDTTTGTLLVKPDTAGCFSGTAVVGCTDAVGLGGSGDVTLSPDGKFLYTPSGTEIGLFARATDGTLSQPNGSQSAMPGGYAASISPSGRHVFVAGADATVVFARAADTGKLTKTDCVARVPVSGCTTVGRPAGLKAAVSPDGTQVALGAESKYTGGVGFYAFDQKTGHLTPEGCATTPIVPGCAGGESSSCFCPSGAATWSPDGSNVYFGVLGLLYNAEVDAAPVCQDVFAKVPQNTVTQIQLSCSDPNGDAVSITANALPLHGALASIDQATSTVTYDPHGSYSGPDSFTYTATAKGVTSAPATVSLTVRPALIIRTRTLKLNAKHKAKVKLTCPASDVSGPCTGKLKIKTRDKVRFDGRHRVVILATATFSLAAGTTKSIRLVFSDRRVQLLEERAGARKVKLVAKVKDAVGNKATVKKKATLKLP